MTGEFEVVSAKNFASILTAAAKADVEKLKSIDPNGANAKSETDARLGSVIKGKVTTKSNVTTEFYEQDVSFTQAACYFESVLKQNLSEDDRKFFEERRRELAKNRTTYLDVITGVKKN